MSVDLRCTKCGYSGESWSWPLLCRRGKGCNLIHIRSMLAQPKFFDAKPSPEKPDERRAVDGVIVEGPPS
jgi:hypothetical protein